MHALHPGTAGTPVAQCTGVLLAERQTRFDSDSGHGDDPRGDQQPAPRRQPNRHVHDGLT